MIAKVSGIQIDVGSLATNQISDWHNSTTRKHLLYREIHSL